MARYTGYDVKTTMKLYGSIPVGLVIPYFQSFEQDRLLLSSQNIQIFGLLIGSLLILILTCLQLEQIYSIRYFILFLYFSIFAVKPYPCTTVRMI